MFPIYTKATNSKEYIPKDNVEHVPRAFDILPIRFRRLNARRMLPVEQTPIHSLIDAGAFSGNDLPRRRRPLRGLSIYSTRDIFTAYGKVPSSDFRIVSSMEFLGELVSTRLQAMLIIGRLTQRVGSLFVELVRRRGVREGQIGL